MINRFPITVTLAVLLLALLMALVFCIRWILLWVMRVATGRPANLVWRFFHDLSEFSNDILTLFDLFSGRFVRASNWRRDRRLLASFGTHFSEEIGAYGERNQSRPNVRCR